mmetsp:Transcript_15694/g.24091  ORF Transcript_15694/g.24091 Transcript_15694/m.24091 type:complete len:148 (-) Transcript_15694:653-1096(-)|eukprot:CAMPEP_0170496758 /NCGR_PEP_ID=MMETSP0208-20121228/22612_1 /TAXON_ID=197538 /ORGANISM="Strombidium inclinatum, Strain S3" /LENGTH=147 /DNA_ID=CAMNT_0010773383 /DNA_START=478 /DNA_END=921 /DNA_ORIENTATION=+
MSLENSVGLEIRVEVAVPPLNILKSTFRQNEVGPISELVAGPLWQSFIIEELVNDGLLLLAPAYHEEYRHHAADLPPNKGATLNASHVDIERWISSIATDKLDFEFKHRPQIADIVRILTFTFCCLLILVFLAEVPKIMQAKQFLGR